MVCSRTVLELTLAYSKTDLEQTFRFFSGINVEHP